MSNALSQAIKAKTDSQLRMAENDVKPIVKESATGVIYIADPDDYSQQLLSGKNISITVAGNAKTINAVMGLLAGSNVSISAPDANGKVTITGTISGKGINITDFTGKNGYALTYNAATDKFILTEIASSYELPQSTETILGGIKAKAKTTEASEVAIDPATGKLYAPSPDQAANGLPAGGTAGQIPIKVDGTDYNAAWGDAPSGGDSGTYYTNAIDQPPASPHSNDDEFDGPSLDEKWAWLNQGTSTATMANGKVVFDLPASMDNTRGLIQPAPSGDFTIIAKINANVREVNYSNFGIIAYNSANNRLVILGKGARLNNRSISVSRLTTTGWSGDLYLSHGIGGVDIYLKVMKVGTTLKFYYSLDGTCWLWILDEDVATHIGALTSIGIAFYRNNNTPTEKMFGLCDWFRVIEP